MLYVEVERWTFLHNRPGSFTGVVRADAETTPTRKLTRRPTRFAETRRRVREWVPYRIHRQTRATAAQRTTPKRMGMTVATTVQRVLWVSFQIV